MHGASINLGGDQGKRVAGRRIKGEGSCRRQWRQTEASLQDRTIAMNL